MTSSPLRLNPEVAGCQVEKAAETFRATLQDLGQIAQVDWQVGTTSPDGPLPPESFEVGHRHETDSFQLMVRDENALAYALQEMAAAALLDPINWRQRFFHLRRIPSVRVRSMAYYPHNRDLDEAYFYDERYWDRWYALMAQGRFNSFSLVFGHQTAYLSPLFPFFTEVPGWEQVETTAYSRQERHGNLQALRMISSKAAQWGIFFTLGVWQQHAHDYGQSLVSGLSYEDLFDYCPRAMETLLHACPGIQGVQFRMNMESGIKEEDQADFFDKMLGAMRKVRPGLRIDLRAKGLRQETIDRAARHNGRFIVSTKFWCEHMGLPGFASEVIAEDRETPIRYRRYGYWDLLARDRPYDLLFRLWTAGSQRLLIWGDPDYAACFARNTLLREIPGQNHPPRTGAPMGYEVMAPLSNKGFGNYPGGNWSILARKEDQWYDWEFERYWAFFLAFGAAGTDPEAAHALFEAEGLRRFGRHGKSICQAIRTASGIIPWITTTHAPSASIFSYWPEMDTGGLSDCYARIPTGDPGRFYSITEFVDALLAGSSSGKTTPLQAARKLDEMAHETGRLLEAIDISPDHPGSAEWRTLRLDLLTLKSLAAYHSARMRSAVFYTFFGRCGQQTWIEAAVQEMRSALGHWEDLAETTGQLFAPHLVFNRPPSQIGHWQDELPLLREELERLIVAARIAQTETDKSDATPQWTERQMEWQEHEGRLSRQPGDAQSCEPLAEVAYEAGARRYAVQTPASLVTAARTHRESQPTSLKPEELLRRYQTDPRLNVDHTRRGNLTDGDHWDVECTVDTDHPVERVTLHYRPSIQVEPWETVTMDNTNPGTYQATIPSEAIRKNWDFEYAFEIVWSDGRGTFWPSHTAGNPFYRIPVETTPYTLPEGVPA